MADAARHAPDPSAAPALTWRWGVKWADFAPEALALGLFDEHWKTAGPYRTIAPLKLNHLRYRSLEGQGLLEILVVRQGFDIAGYLWWTATRSSMASDVTAGQIEAIWADPRHRGPGLCGGLGWQMIKATVARIAGRGITIARFAEKADRKVGAHLKRLGFEPSEVSYTRLLNPVRPA